MEDITPRDDTPASDASMDDEERAVFDAQDLLAVMGYPVGEPDGRSGPATRRAISLYCRARGETCSGGVDAALLASLRTAQGQGHAYEPPEPGSGVAAASYAAETGAPVSERVFQDCAACPEMVAVPGGGFRMGVADGERDQRPARTVRFSVPFAVARYETTWDEWNACVRERACSSAAHGRGRADNEWGRGRRPVIHVSWDEAQRYVRWLNSKVEGSPYRLPSESEWEYAGRAGSTAAYPWGSSQPSCANGASNGANYRDCADNRTRPVGGFAPNRFGLYDMQGNVSEWVADCYRDTYEGAPTNGRAVTSGDCGLRVLRGGSWYASARYLTSAQRHRLRATTADNDIGFRVARDLEQ